MGVSEVIITPEQSRAGRALLDWSQEELASKAQLSGGSVRHFEKGRQPLTPASLQALRTALEQAGIEFIPGNGKGPGVRVAKGSGKQTGHSATIPVLKAKGRK